MFGTLSLPPRDGRSTQSLSLGVRRDVGHSDGEVERPFMAGPGPMLDECGDRHKSTVAGSCRPTTAFQSKVRLTAGCGGEAVAPTRVSERKIPDWNRQFCGSAQVTVSLRSERAISWRQSLEEVFEIVLKP
jgi:hypothetical protein